MEFVEYLRISNFGSVRSTEVALTPLHAFVGPNDSGKSTILRSLEALSGFAFGFPPGARQGEIEQIVTLSARRGVVEFEARTSSLSWSIQTHANGQMTGTLSELNPPRRSWPVGIGAGHTALANLQHASSLRAVLGDYQLLRLDPDSIRRPNVLIPRDRKLRLSDDRGAGVAGLLDAIRDRNEHEFHSVRSNFIRLFPNVRELQLRNVSEGHKGLQLLLHDGTEVPADLMSAGMLYYLAIEVLARVGGTRLVLFEEPENGLHPARIREVMGVLRRLSSTVQIVIATHSPMVLNELNPPEVTVLTRGPQHGTVATPISKTSNFEERSSVYRLGELWVSYSDGINEAPLFATTEPTPDPGDEQDWPETAE